MNEKIREIADTARFVSGNEYPTQDEVFEKFAQLIVQECANKCQELAADYAAVANSKFVTEGGKTLHNGMWGGATYCASEIKQHFEIE